MGYDLNQSRRNYNETCTWWSRDERDQNEPNELVMKRIPSGQFMAKEITAEQIQDVIVSNAFIFDKTTTLIKSPDNLIGIKNKDLIKYRGEFWIVTNVQKTKARVQNTVFAKDNYCSHYWYIELRK